MNSQLAQQLRRQQIEHLMGGKDHVFGLYKHSKSENGQFFIARATLKIAFSLKLRDEQSIWSAKTKSDTNPKFLDCKTSQPKTTKTHV